MQRDGKNLDLPGMIKNVVDVDSKTTSPINADSRIADIIKGNYVSN